MIKTKNIFHLGRFCYKNPLLCPLSSPKPKLFDPPLGVSELFQRFQINNARNISFFECFAVQHVVARDAHAHEVVPVQPLVPSLGCLDRLDVVDLHGQPLAAVQLGLAFVAAVLQLGPR